MFHFVTAQSCQYTDYANSVSSNKVSPPFCIGADNWSPQAYANLPNGQCHPNVCGTGVCCKTGQSAHNCPVFDANSINIFQKPISSNYQTNPFQKFRCMARPGLRPMDPIETMNEKEPLRFVRYWQSVDRTCDTTGRDSANRCKNTLTPTARSCNALYETDTAYLKVPVESFATSGEFVTLTEFEGMTLPAIKGLNTVLGANRVALRPKVTHKYADFPRNDLPEALSFCRVYKENRPFSPTKFVITSLKVGGPSDGAKFFAGRRQDWLAFFGPTVMGGECAVYGGYTNAGISNNVIEEIDDPNKCARECARTIACGHWVHDGREKKCYLFSRLWSEAKSTKRVGAWSHKIATSGPPCGPFTGLGENSAAGVTGKASIGFSRSAPVVQYL